MLSRHWLGCLSVAFGFLAVGDPTAIAEDRLAKFQKLSQAYEAAEKEFVERELPDKPSQEQLIQRWDDFPAWSYLPRFLKMAEAQPDDDVAFQCCLWILDRTRNVGNRARKIYSIEQAAWTILAEHHTNRADLAKLCMRATEYPAPAQEAFLRGLKRRADLSKDHQGFATLALAELLALRFEGVEFRQQRREPESDFQKHLKDQEVPEWKNHLDPADAATIQAEAAVLFREVLSDYADVPVEFSAPGFRNFKSLGQKAKQSLHALEYLTIGSEAPEIKGKDLQGRPLKLSDYRGKVVVISFWFTGCGPCMELIPTEERLVETYKDQPFALLGICGDESRDQALKTAKEHGMTWPCWFDGKARPIVRDWNVSGWPTIYVLSRDGRIVAKDLRDEELEAKVKELMEE